jgi:hypothetical protein
VRALVMELVPGAPIKGPLPLETALITPNKSPKRWKPRMKKESCIAI